MVYRTSTPAPVSQVPEERRGREVGIFCLECGSVYPLHRARHVGRAMHGRDHIAAPCAHEGEGFDPDEDWWEPAIEVLPPPPEPEPERAADPAPA